MSLIVAQMTSGGPQIVSDMRLSIDHEVRPNPKTDILKALVLSKTIVVCFAGNVELALESIREANRQLIDGVECTKIITYLASKTSGNEVEFLYVVGRLESEIIRIRAGNIETKLEVAWVGDPDAFSAFQNQRNVAYQQIHNQRLRSDYLRIGSCMSDAMDHVIADPSISSVDGCSVSIVWQASGFNYLPSTFVHVGRDVTFQSGEDLISLMLQPVEHGGYAVSIVEPKISGTPALALNFPVALLTYVYMPLQFDEAIVIKNVSARDIASTLLHRYGLAINEPMIR